MNNREFKFDNRRHGIAYCWRGAGEAWAGTSQTAAARVVNLPAGFRYSRVGCAPASSATLIKRFRLK
jgi:hypothetical protein